MENQFLRNPEILPNDELIKESLGSGFVTYKKFIDQIIGNGCGLVVQWNYYKDGKAWLCKVSYKKKTIFWLSVWEGFFQLGFYFNQNNYAGVLELDICESIKTDFRNSSPIGKLMPLVIRMQSIEQIEDVIKIIHYKKGLK